MKLITTVTAALLAAIQFVAAKEVFAHFMVANAADYSYQEWLDDIRLAKQAHIDGFALNAARDTFNEIQSLNNAFAAADQLGFKLFFSFDYAASGPWDKRTVRDRLLGYRDRRSYYKYKGHPLASTFEGAESAEDWRDIKKWTDCFLVPDWSSLDPFTAVSLAGGVADGLFGWKAWPYNAANMDTGEDEAYLEALRASGKPYMMPVSPWFYTNLPAWNKNFLWRGDSLWQDRWDQVNRLQPEWVQIISWNDYGESHYIGPIKPIATKLLREWGSAPYDYVEGMPHDGWRATLPFTIDMYKDRSAVITREALSFWYRPNPHGSCSTAGTVGNNVAWQSTMPVTSVMQDRIFISAVLTKYADALLWIGTSAPQWVTWSKMPPNGGAGIYHGSVDIAGRTGGVNVVVYSGEAPTMWKQDGRNITRECQYQNYNAWVGEAFNPTPVRVTASVRGGV